MSYVNSIVIISERWQGVKDHCGKRPAKPRPAEPQYLSLLRSLLIFLITHGFRRGL